MTTADEKMREEYQWQEFQQWADRTFGGEFKHEDFTTYNRMFAAWQASAAQYSERIEKLQEEVKRLTEYNDALLTKLAKYEQRHLADQVKYSQDVRELEQQNEHLQAQVSLLYNANRTYKNAVAYANQYAHLPDAQEEISTAIHLAESEWEIALSATIQTAEAYKRRIQAEVLEAAASTLEEEDEPLRISENEVHVPATRLLRMAAELKEGE